MNKFELDKKKRFEEKFKDCEVLDVKNQGNNYRLTVRHICGNVRDDIYFYNVIKLDEFPCLCNGKQKNKNISYYQKLLDEKFGEGNVELLSYKNSNSPSDLKLNCGHTITRSLKQILKQKNDSIKCPECGGGYKRVKFFDYHDINKRIKKNLGSKVTYISGFENRDSECIFRFDPCGHEFKAKFKSLENTNKNTFVCPVCTSRKQERLLTRNKEVDNFVLPIYKAKQTEILSDNSRHLTTTVECLECGKEVGKINTKHLTGKIDFTPNCDCELKEQQRIAENLFDLLHTNKTKNISQYISSQFIYNFHLQRLISFNISKKLNKELLSLDNDFKSLKDIKFNIPYPKIQLKFNDLMIDVKQNTKYIIHSANVIKVNEFNIDSLIEISYSSPKRKELRTVIWGNRLTTQTNIFKIRDNSITLMLRTVVNMLNYITNQDNIYQNTINKESGERSYISENKFDDNTMGLVEYRTITKNYKNKYIYSKVNKVSKRKIRASYDVTGHYRHYVKTGKKIFIASFEKGKQYRHIRRIEKDYIIK